MRQIEQYKKMAAEYERLARAVNDETFERCTKAQWREAAQRAEIADPVLPAKSARCPRDCFPFIPEASARPWD